MKMLWHNEPLTDRPFMGISPRPSQGSNKQIIRKKRNPVTRTNGQKYDPARLSIFKQRHMHRTLPFRQRHGEESPPPSSNPQPKSGGTCSATSAPSQSPNEPSTDEVELVPPQATPGNRSQKSIHYSLRLSATPCKKHT